MAHRIDALQYCAWNAEIFDEMALGAVDAVHATVGYHETFAEVVANLAAWDRRLHDHSDRIVAATSAADIRAARATGRTAILFGLQNPGAVEADLGRVGVLHRLGIRIMQITYNLQSLLGSGWQEPTDSGLTRFGTEVIREMNGLGMVIDLSHAGARTAREAVDASRRPVAITHANPRRWRATDRNASDEVIEAVCSRGGMLGFSLYPHHLANGSECRLTDFAEMVARTAERVGAEHLGIGSDLCQGQPDSVVQWMRDGRWTHARSDAVFPAMPEWFGSNRDWDTVAGGLRAVGFSATEVDGIMGENWLAYWNTAMMPA